MDRAAVSSWPTVVSRLQETVEIIPQLAEAIRQGRVEQAADHMRRIAEGEETAYIELNRVVRATDITTSR